MAGILRTFLIAVASLALLSLTGCGESDQQASAPPPQSEPQPAPAPEPAPPPPEEPTPSAPPSGNGGTAPEQPQEAQLPEFPWPPPAASASYVLPDKLFASYRTVGDVVDAILSAFERGGYVERSFFRTEAGGVALVTRLERINDDGSPFAESERWPAGGQNYAARGSLFSFLQGLFYVDAGHYRVIVFILQDLPFAQSSENITAEEAQAWLTSGGNVLPAAIAQRPFAGAHCTVLIYEFASDGTKVSVVVSSLTGKQHLEKAGLLPLDAVQ